MLARCVATLKPPPELTLSQWADRYRMLSAESSAEPGRWHTDKAPYQREIMDAIGDAHIRRVVIMCAAQLGKTELLLNILGYFMAYAPAPILVMQPTLDMGQTFSKDRLAPMIRDTPVLRGLVDVKSRYAGNTILKKNFPGGHITIVGANSATGLASRPIKVLLADEVDRYPGSAGTEGDPLSLAQKRQTTFWDKKTVMVSTPVIKGHSRIETEYNQSTREEWNVPCPECGHYQPFVWANLIFDPDDLQKEIVYKCERCGCVANEYRWKQQSQQGRFVAENPGAETRGFHLNTLASTFCGWKEIVQKFIVAKERFLLAEARADTVAVPAGTRVKTQGGRYFNTLDYAEIPPGSTYVDTIVQAEEAGAESSGILAGEINILVDPIPYIASVSNVDESTGGLDVEDDDSLTERAYLAPSRFSCAGPRDAYEYHVREWRSDVTDVQITSPEPCVIAIYFVMEGGRLPNATEREELAEYISGENLRPLCDKVVCVEPEEVPYNIAFTYWIGDGDQRSAGTIQEKVTAAVQSYQSWQRHLGRDINPTELIAKIREAGAKRVKLTAPADIVVGRTQLPKCTGQTVTYGGLEDD